jgi:Uma2 family endonuclease
MVDNSLIEKSLTVPTYPIWRLTVEQYHEMIEAGILTEDDPVELLEGWLVTKMTKKPQHSLATQLTSNTLARVVPADWFINVQEPITTADSEPEPDVTIERGNRRDYSDRHPSPEDVALVVEVADATLQRDRTLKLRLYAKARVTTYWILNLVERQLEVYTNPIGKDIEADYQQRRVYQESDVVPIMINGQEIARVPVREFLA